MVPGTRRPRYGRRIRFNSLEALREWGGPQSHPAKSPREAMRLHVIGDVRGPDNPNPAKDDETGMMAVLRCGSSSANPGERARISRSSMKPTSRTIKLPH
jgi:hypothetical protein